MNEVLAGYDAFLAVVKVVLFWVAVAVAVVALVDWIVRTRRVSPFGPVARFSRRYFDPLMRPVESRIVRAGHLPTHAPWWTLGVVIVGGLLLISLLQFLGGMLRSVTWGLSSPGAFGLLLLSWAFLLLKIALLVRVISSWVRISPYSRWVRWSFVLTEWMLRPLRRLIPSFGGMDFTPFIAWLAIALVQGALGIP